MPWRSGDQKRSVRPATRETLPQRNPVQEIVTADELSEQAAQAQSRQEEAEDSQRQTTHNGYQMSMRIGSGEMRHRNRRARKHGWY